MKIWIIAILIGIVVVSGCLKEETTTTTPTTSTTTIEVSTSVEKTTTTTISNVDPCKEARDLGELQSCYTAVATDTKDPSFCDMKTDLSNETLLHLCGINPTDVWVNVSYCDKTYGELWRNYCLEELAQTTENASFCKFINGTGWMGRCYRNLAIDTKDASFCELIDERYLVKYGCLRKLGALNDSMEKKFKHCISDSECVASLYSKYSEECINIRYANPEGLIAETIQDDCGFWDCCEECACKCVNNSCTTMVK